MDALQNMFDFWYVYISDHEQSTCMQIPRCTRARRRHKQLAIIGRRFGRCQLQLQTTVLALPNPPVLRTSALSPRSRCLVVPFSCHVPPFQRHDRSR